MGAAFRRAQATEDAFIFILLLHPYVQAFCFKDIDRADSNTFLALLQTGTARIIDCNLDKCSHTDLLFLALLRIFKIKLYEIKDIRKLLRHLNPRPSELFDLTFG